jgi:hypothetical protein
MERERQNRKDRRGQAKRERQNGKGRTGLAEQDDRTGQAEQERQNGTGRAGKTERDRQNRMTERDRQNMIFCRRTVFKSISVGMVFFSVTNMFGDIRVYCFETVLLCDVYRLMMYCYATFRCVTYRSVAAPYFILFYLF